MNYRIGDKFTKEFVIKLDDGIRFAEISGDNNPIHLDEQVAKNTRFGKRIVHGMLIGSYFSSIIGNDFPGNGSIYMEQDLKFLSPIYYDEMISLEVEIVDIIIEKKRIILSTKCLDSNQRLLVDGKAMVFKEDL